MSRQNHIAPKLPKELLDRVNPSGTALGQLRGGKRGPLHRKEQRKANRVQKKVQQRQPRRPGGRDYHPERDQNSIDEDDLESSPEPAPVAKAEKSAKVRQDTSNKPPKLIMKKASKDRQIPQDSDEEDSRDLPPMSRSTKMALAQDEAEIALLEKRLGLSGKKTNSKAFADDGLDELLEGIDDIVGFNQGIKRRREDEEWLKNKRTKTATTEKSDDESQEDTSISGDGFGSEAGHINSDIPRGQTDEKHEDKGSTEASFSDFGDDDGGFISGDSDTEEPSPPPPKRVRENPYLPGIPASTEPSAKYVPPSLRGPPKADAEALSRLRRQIQGLFNRLSEANMMTILREIEGLFHSNPRQYVTSTLIDLIIGLICDRASLMDTFIILHAGFVSAVYKVIGTQFGAQLLERMVSEFDKFYDEEQRSGNGRKEASNMIALFAEMYTFQVLSSTVMFDLIRLLLVDLSELNTELLLKLIKNCGPQLRQDDPSALKDIVFLLQKSVAEKGESNLPVRTKFMIETINNLKNNRMKTGLVASAMASEHTTRMKKMLGTMNQRNIKASEPLGIGLEDIRNGDKSGKWWLVGASWKNEARVSSVKGGSKELRDDVDENGIDDSGTGTPSIPQLAKEQRMNTDIRRAIFVNIMSATDYKDAYIRLKRIKLKKSQELEVPRVLLHCAGAEHSYNPFYTLIAKKLCGDHKLRMAFQFSLWGLFRRLGEKDDLAQDDGYGGDEEEDEMDLRKIVNLAKVYANLISAGSLHITILKILNFTYLQPKSKTFLEVLLVTVFQNLEKKAAKSGVDSEKSLVDIFAKAKEAPQMLAGLQYFLSNTVKSSSLALSNTEKAALKRACRTAVDTLTLLSA